MESFRLQKCYSSPNRGLRWIFGRAKNLEYDNDFFDLMFSVDVIHHISNRAAYFREVFRVLKY